MSVLHRPLVLRVVVVLALAVASVLTVSGPARAVDGATAIAAKHAELGGAGGSLGSTATPVICGLRASGCYRGFQRGTVYWSAASGAHVVTGGTVAQRWAAQKWEAGPIGYPVGDTVCGISDNGCFQHFQAASIFSSTSGGTHAVWGAIRLWWWANGSETGIAGYPTTEEICGLRGGGCYQGFTKGTVYWSPATGAHLVTGGAVADRWAAQGWEAGPLGYPTSDTRCGLIGLGCAQHFQQGSVYSSPAGGTRAVWGAIRARYAASGWELGDSGYPMTEEICGLRGGGCYQVFEHTAVYWSPPSGAHVVGAAFSGTWGLHGWETGPLGYPTSDLTCGLVDGGCSQRFQGGSMYESASTDVSIVLGAIRDRWLGTGAENGELGYPLGDEQCGLWGGGCRQEFEGGLVSWSPATGAHPVVPPVLDAYLFYEYWDIQTAEFAYGYPTGPATCGSGRCTQQFTTGRIDHDLSTGSSSGWHRSF